MSDIEKTLKERGDRYGSFFDHAMIAQNLQDTMRKCEGWDMLAPDQKQALTVISDKIARMLNGQPDYRDNWHDIVGYAKLVDDRLALSESTKEKAKSEHSETIINIFNGDTNTAFTGCLGCGKYHHPNKPCSVEI